MPEKPNSRRKPRGQDKSETPAITKEGEASKNAVEPSKLDSSVKLGRPTDFTTELTEEICERIAMGESVRQICLLEHMPAERTFYAWLMRHEDFQQNYARAKEVQMNRFDEELLEIADDSRNDWIERENERTGKSFIVLNEEAVSRSKLRASLRQWLMSKHRPKKYGDKLAMEHSGKIDSTVTLTEARRAEILERRRHALTGGN